MLAIIIPTKNRSAFLSRQLLYYSNVKCPHTIYIGDSSDEEHSDRILSVIDKVKDSIKVVYKHYPDSHFSPRCLKGPVCIRELLRIAKEKYAVFVGDDDFLVPKALTKCATFLDENPEYRTAQGKANLFSISCDGAYGGNVAVCAYRLKENVLQTSNERLIGFMKDYYVLMFSVHRTEEFLQDHENVESLTDMNFVELMCCGLSIIRGKSKQLNDLYLVRQAHNARWPHPDLFNWLTSPNWGPSFQVFHDTLRDALIEKEKIDRDTASRTVNLAFEQYFKNAFADNLLTRKQTIMPSIKNKLGKRLPGLKQAYHLARNRIPVFRIEMSLAMLLNERSPYHKDFMPIYREITNPPTN